jgi:hypothetical protein
MTAQWAGQAEEFRATRARLANAKLKAYRDECWRLAILARRGVVQKQDAIDLLQEIAIAHALVRALGEDRVQAILDEAFASADFRPMEAEVV